MTDLRDQIAAQLDLDTWCGTSPERIAEIVRPVIAAHECTCGLDDLGPVERETVTRIAGAALDAIRGERP